MKYQKTSLVVIYNHNYERNIPLIRKMYQDRFSQVLQIMPFYTGSDQDVIGVFGNSFQFHGYIAQARPVLESLECDRFLFIGDDLILNPRLNEQTISSMMKLEKDDCFYPGFHDVSCGDCLRGTMEAHNFEYPPAGIDDAVLKRLPSKEEAFLILRGKGLMGSMSLSRVKPYFTLFKKPLMTNLYENYKTLRARAWHVRNLLRYKINPQTASYPVVFGYSDIFSLPKHRFSYFCKTLEIFSSIRMFVELAIPTALALTDWNIVQESDLDLKSLNVWFPLDPKLFAAKMEIIENFEAMTSRAIENLAKSFPSDYLYIHPVKLSNWY